MLIARFIFEQKICCGMLQRKKFRLFENDIFNKTEFAGEQVLADDVRLLPPVNIGVVFSLGGNDLGRIEEMAVASPEIPAIVGKPERSIIGNQDTVEAEIAGIDRLSNPVSGVKQINN